MLPIELSSSDTLTVPLATQADWVFTPDRTVYANVLALVEEMQDVAPSYINVYFGDSQIGYENHVVIETTDTFSGSVSGDTINEILGNLTVLGSQKLRGSFTPLYSWFPRYRSKDGKWFTRRVEDEFKGVKGIDGNLSGVTYTGRKVRNFQWPFIESYNAIENASQSTNDSANRCFEYVMALSRTRTLIYEDSDNINIKGLYYIDNISEYQGSTAILPTEWGDGKPNRDNCVWCSGRPDPVGENSDDRTDAWFDTSATLTSAVAPEWPVYVGPA